MNDQSIPSAQIFKLVFMGWFWAIAGVFIPICLTISVIELFHDPREAAQGFLAIILVPAIAAGQGLIIGAAVVFGLWLYRRFGASLVLFARKRAA